MKESVTGTGAVEGQMGLAELCRKDQGKPYKVINPTLDISSFLSHSIFTLEHDQTTASTAGPGPPEDAWPKDVLPTRL